MGIKATEASGYISTKDAPPLRASDWPQCPICDEKDGVVGTSYSVVNIEAQPPVAGCIIRTYCIKCGWILDAATVEAEER